MNSKELMIGNQVQTDKGLRVEIRAINFDSAVVQDGPVADCIPVHRLSGIAIDEDWLYRLGFTHFSCNPYWNTFTTKNGFLVSFCLKDTGDLYAKGEIMAGSSETKVEFIHTLMNLFFALCGQELALTEILTPTK